MKTKHLPFWTAGHIALMIVLALVFGKYFSPMVAYVATLIAYWSACWLIIMLFRQNPVHVVRARRTMVLLDWLSFVPLGGIAYVMFSKSTDLPSPPYLIVIVVLAFINGFTEENYWRKLYADSFSDNFKMGMALPCFLFAIWHVALLTIPGIAYAGGAPALVGGALVLGTIWGLSYWYNRDIGRISLAHSSLNVLAFAMLARDNNWTGG